MGTATERFSDYLIKRTIDGNWQAQRGWDVIGFTDPDDAVSSTGVDVGDAHPLWAPLKCTRIAPTDNKLTLCRVVAEYEVTSLIASAVDPTKRPWIVRWKQVVCNEKIDTDLNGNAILNAAGDAFKEPGSRDFVHREFTVTRYEASYDQTQAKAITNTVNNGPVTFLNEEFLPGQLRCTSYQPVEDYEVGASYVKVQYRFLALTPNSPNLTDMQVRHPHQLRRLNQGLRGRYRSSDMADEDTPAFGDFYLKEGTRITRDVLLQSDGTPLDITIKVTNSMLEPVGIALPAGVLSDDIEDGSGNVIAVFLIYMRYAEIDYSEIGVSGGEDGDS